MSRGRKPTPTFLKLLDGNPGKRPINDAEPSPTIELPDAPLVLDDLAREEWDRLAPELVKLGILSGIDRLQLATYCQAYSRWVKAEDALAEDGYVLFGSGEKGGAYQNPMLAVANKAMEQMLKIAAEFGMTPSSRTKIKVDVASEAAKSPLTAFARSKNA